MTSYHQVEGWTTPDGDVLCMGCKPVTEAEDNRYDRLRAAKQQHKPITQQQQDFLDMIEQRVSPLVNGEIHQWWSEKTHGLVCSKCGAEIQEEDTEYAALYTVFEKKIVGYIDAHFELFCISDTEAYSGAVQPLTPINLGATFPDSTLLLQDQQCHYQHCYMEVLIEQFTYELEQFAHDWPDLPILDYYREKGLLNDRPARE